MKRRKARQYSALCLLSLKKMRKATGDARTAYISFEIQYNAAAASPINPEISITDNALILSGYLILCTFWQHWVALILKFKYDELLLAQGKQCR